MLPPSEFARMAVVHGTVATVSDPHEIANVLGTAGVHFMLDDAARPPLKFCFGAPSCVPATLFETAGATLDAWVKSALGCVLKAPFMTLSFLALPVIPRLKMTDKGLFDAARFDYVPVEKAFGEAGYSGG